MRLIAMLMFIPALASAAEPGGKSVAWLVGCWSTADGSALEVWVANNDQSLSGFGVALHNNKVGFYEVLRIEQQVGGQWIYTAHPSGQDSTSFAAIAYDENSVVFSNPDHDFPQEIKYRKDGDSLYATTSLLGGANENSFFKVACESLPD